MPDLVIFSLFGLVAGFAYIRYLLKKKHRSTHIGNLIDELDNDGPEIPPDYEQATVQPPPY